METLKEKSIDNSRIAEIRDIVAKNRGYENWETLNGSDLYDSDIDEVARLYSESKTAQLKADKEELLSALKKISKVTDEGYVSDDTDFEVWESELKQVHGEIESLIQKHKLCEIK